MDKIEKIKSLLAMSPNDNFLQHALALEYIKIGAQHTARILFETLLSNDPDYVGSYYHLSKVLEELNEVTLAKEWYEKGMVIAKKMNDNHSYNELRAAYEELTF